MKRIRVRSALLSFALCVGGAASAQASILLYDNTTTDTFDTVLYSSGSYTALGDRIHLFSAGTATQAKVQMYNNGDAGTFDADLSFFLVDSPAGGPLASFQLAGIFSAGSDVIDLTFDLGAGLPVPQDLIFTVSVSHLSGALDLGLNLFEPPTVGTSDNSFLIAAVAGTGFSLSETNGENIYFQLAGTSGVADAPEAASVELLGTGLAVMGLSVWYGRKRGGWAERQAPLKLKAGCGTPPSPV